MEPRTNEFRIEVGMGATGCYWSDTYAYEVVRVVSDKTVDIRRMDATPAEGYDYYGDQVYNYSSNENNPIERVRRCKYGWRTADGMHVSFGHACEYRDPCF